MRDEDIDFSDIPKMGPDFFKKRDPVAEAEETDHAEDRSRCTDVFSQAWAGISVDDECCAAEIYGSAEREGGLGAAGKLRLLPGRTAEGPIPF